MNLLCFTFIFINGVVSEYQSICTETSSTSLKNNQLLIKSQIDGDYNIQNIFTITKSDDCSQVSFEGLLRVFAVKYAIRTINQRTDILPKIKLGYIFNDACMSLPVTMSHGIELVNNYRRHQCSINNSRNTCANVKNKVVGVIGEYYSFSTIKLANLLSLHNIPQISDGASSPLLNSSNSNFKSFFRTIQSDAIQIDVMIEILKEFKWNYVFAIGSDDDYGKVAISILKARMVQERLCIVEDIYVPFTQNSQMKSNVQNIIKKLKNSESAKVVIMFNYPKGIGEYILREAYEMNLSRIWLTSEAWNPDILGSNAPISQLESLLTVSLHYGDEIPEFKGYLNDAVKSDYLCDFWLNVFIKNLFNCLVHNKTADGKHLMGESINKHEECKVSVDEIVAYLNNQSLNQVNYLIDAVNVLAYALNATACNKTFCRLDVQPQEVTKSLKIVRIPSVIGEFVEFDFNHNPKFSQYSIDQIHLSGGKAKYVRVGTWNTKSKVLNISSSAIKWPSWVNHKVPISSCRIDCKPGEKVVGRQSCCWACENCPPGKVSNTLNADNCFECPANYHTKDSISCILTPVSYVSYSSPVGIAGITISCIGGFLTITSYLIFLVLRKKSVIFMRNSILYTTLSDLLPFSTFCYAFLELSQPSRKICLAQDACFNLLMIFYAGILFVKNRAVGHFLSKSFSCLENEKTLLMVFFILLVLIEAILLAVWLNERETFVFKVNIKNELFVRCTYTSSAARLLARLFPALSLLVGAIQTLPERNSKYNFGELRNLFFFGVTLTVITSAYGITINQVSERFQPFIILITTNGFGFTYLLCLSLPKLYIAFKSISKTVCSQSNLGYTEKT